MRTARRFARMVAIGMIAALPLPTSAQTVIDEWTSAKLPPPPALKPVTLVAPGTAVLVLDLTSQTVTLTKFDLISY